MRIEVLGAAPEEPDLRMIEPRNHRPIAVLRRDRSRVVGGLTGTTVWRWLQIAQLWVEETLRARGHGTASMAAAEAQAIGPGCQHALLDTFDFQAREFYEGLGYETFGNVQDVPRGHTRFFMRKALTR
jgi:GNAT superfamily N-acetyltransferase